LKKKVDMKIIENTCLRFYYSPIPTNRDLAMSSHRKIKNQRKMDEDERFNHIRAS